jgi:predicted RNA-binding Zn ribbon-like protein
VKRHAGLRPYEVYPGQPGGREPAPGPLALVQAFVNTVDYEHGIEGFDSPARLRAFLLDHRLVGGDADVDEGGLRSALAVREALRAQLLVHSGELPPAGGAEPLERAARAAHLTLAFANGTPQLVPQSPGVDGALGRILAIVSESALDGTWPRLKACRRSVCQWAFYDRSRNGSSSWCSMAVCGNRTKTGSYRRRRRG